MPAFKITLVGLLYFFASLALGSKCPQDAISKLVVCYYKGEISLTNFNICNCTHVVFTNAVKRAENGSISAIEDTIKYLEVIKQKKGNISAIFTLEAKQDDTSSILKSENRTEDLINGIVDFLQESQFDGVELNFKFGTDDGVSKESYASFVKKLSKTLSNHKRVKREGYDVFEKLQDDITTESYTTQTPKNSTSKTESIKEEENPKESNRKVREQKKENEDDADYLTLEEAINFEFSKGNSEDQVTLKDVEDDTIEEKFLIFVRLSIKPEIIAKKYDLKALSRYADFLSVPTHDIVNTSEEHLTYHPSRLMGLSDILNTDSILDFLTGMGALKSKLVISLPATVLKFQLKDESKNTPRSPSRSKPQVIDQSQLCTLFSKNNWTIERDDDLTAPYAFSGKTWLSFEDEISINIKGKYILLRELAGGAIYPIDSDVNDGLCANRTGSGGYLTGVLHKNFESLERKPRALVLASLQDEIHENAFTNVEAGVKLSEYRIVRVVDHSGAVHIIRKNTKTQFECSRQGYFSHPLGCNKFYRCVKFDQYSDEFTVFEYDCPAGLAFDERWEVCVWPGSLPHGAPCTGSSEIAPVPRSHYQCPNHEGYYADPENCRWFFACLDHARDGVTPLTAYEFRCPFGLVFSEAKLACDWPWLVGGCGNRGAAGFLQVSAAGQSQGIHTATFINGGNLEASFGQYGNTDQEDSFVGFGKKFGSGLKVTGGYNAETSYQGAQSAGFGYIAGQVDDSHDRGSFAAFPEYEISGGRILNKGGVVLDQNIAGISSIGAGGSASFAGAGNTGSTFRAGGARSFVGTGGSGSLIGAGHGGSIVSGGHSSGSFAGTGGAGSIISAGGTTTFTGSGGSVGLVDNGATIGGAKTAGSFGGAGSATSFTGTGGSVSFIASGQGGSGFSGAGASGNAAGNFGTTSTSFGKTSGYFQTVTPSIKFETPTLKAKTLEISGISSGGQNSISTPKPFSVHIPSVQINEEKISQFDQHSTVGLTTPQTLIFKETPRTESIGITGQQFSTSHGFTASQSTVPVVTPTTDTYALGGISSEGFGTSQVKTDVSLTNFGSTPKTEVHRFGQFKQSEFPGKFSGVPTVTGTAFGYSSATGSTTPVPPVSVAVPVVTPKPGIQTFGYTASHGVGISSSSPTETPFAGFTQQNYEFTDQGSVRSTFGKAYPTVQTSVFKNVNQGQNAGQSGVSFGAPLVTATPSIFSGVKTGSDSAAHLTGVSAGPTVTSFIQNTVDEKVSNELKFNKLQTFGAPTVTPKTEFHTFPKVDSRLLNVNSHVFSNNIPTVTPKTNQIYSQTGVTGKSQVSFNVPAVTPQPELNPFKYEEHIGVTPLVPFEPAATITNSFEKDFPKVSFNVPAAVQFDQTTTFQQKGISQTGKTTYSVPLAGSGVQTDSAVSQFPQVTTPVQSSFGQRYSSFKATGQIQPFSSTPKVQHSNILTEVSIEQQPVVSFGTIGSNSLDKTLSTPRTYTSSQDTFSQTPAVNTFSFKSTYAQPQHIAVTTPAPVVSITPSTPVSPHSLNVISKSKQQDGFSFGTSTPAPGAVIFNEKSSTLGQEFKSFSPVVQVSTPVSVTYKQDGFKTHEKAYFPAVTPKTEVFGSTIHHGSQGSFGTTEGSQILVQPKQPFVNQQFQERRTEFVQHQVPLQVSTPVPEYKAAVSTGKPREQLVELEISKSVELHPPQFTQSSGFLSQNIPAQQVEIQKQPLHLISQKSFPTKPVVQPFYKQEKEILHTQINNIPENRYQEQFLFQQPINVQTQKPEKQFLPGTSTYTTTSSIKIGQPVGYSAVPALPVFEASKVPFTSQKETVVSKTNVYQPGFADKQPSRVNLLLPTVTEAPQFVTSQTEELAIQTHKNFDSLKINKFGSTPVQNVFVQTTLKPAINAYETFQYNLTTGQSGFGSGVKFGNNPNIIIPEPPREYVLAQNAYTTVAPEAVTRESQFASTESIRSGYKSSTYLPPSRAKSSKATVISVGNLDEGVRDSDVHQVFDRYSGRFGQIINGRNENIATKVIKGEGRGTIEVDKQGSSTVQYEVSSTTPRPRGRGRQYHGGITSGIQAANKYEEYEIEGGSQRSYESAKDNGDFSKTTIDLKNLKLDKNKKTVIVVSQVSDANPVLVGKLAGQCSCQSNMLELRGKNKNSKGGSRGKNKENQRLPAYITNEYLPPFESDQPNSAGEGLSQGERSSPAPETVFIDGSKSFRNGVSYSTEQTLVSSTTALPEVSPSTILSSLGPDGVLSITPKAVYSDERRNKKKQFRGRARYLAPTPSLTADGLPLLSPVPASEIASTFDDNGLKGDESRTQNEIDGGRSKAVAGAAYERYGPGGWRAFDETLQGSIDCKRPGLFRHPKYCNKFYACNYDPWEERYTLHIFNCPIHLTYDNSISACNWPVRGPACADDNLLV